MWRHPEEMRPQLNTATLSGMVCLRFNLMSQGLFICHKPEKKHKPSISIDSMLKVLTSMFVCTVPNFDAFMFGHSLGWEEGGFVLVSSVIIFSRAVLCCLT